MIEEKQSKPNGEVNIIQYVRGNFLGKVSNYCKCGLNALLRVDSQSATSLLESKTRRSSLGN